MCGIVGGFKYFKEHDNTLIKSALKMMKNRGPNDEGFEIYDQEDKFRLILGHTRLSIIDLSIAGHQPMATPDGRFITVFNGEIYNYKELKKELKNLGHSFFSDSDTEVLLAAWKHWGEESLRYIDGMFAFVIFDKKENSLTCVRDAFGIKPFFYSCNKGSFFFSSDIHALIELSEQPKKVCYQRAYDYLVHGLYDNNELTFIDGINHLMPGYLIKYDLSNVKIKKISKWYSPNLSERNDLSFEQASELVRERFLENIRLQLRSDVPLGAALSGGIDSSAVVCAMRYLEPKADIHTFSYIAKNDPISEEKWVDLINSYTNSYSYKVEASDEDLSNDLDDLIRAQGEPFMSTSIYAQYRVFKLAKMNGITVTLDGQGADELLAGYRGYPVQRMKSLIHNRELKNLLIFFYKWGGWPGRNLIDSMKCLGAAVMPNYFIPILKNLFLVNKKPKWINVDLLEKNNINLDNNSINNYIDIKGRNVVAKLADSIQANGLPQLLRHADRNSMNFSIESRVPFLTTLFADLTLGLPEQYLISNNGETKSIFRSAMRGIVPDIILDRKDKIGFATPEQKWLVKMGPQIKNWLEDGIRVPIFNKTELINEFDMMISGKKSFSWQIWRWINFVRWCQIYDIEA